VSDRGAQFTGHLWTRICKMLRIKRRLSTAFSPETDGATERMNQVIEAFLREYANYAQDDWSPWLSIAVAAICGRDAASTGVSPFFLSHGWQPDLFEDFADELTRDKRKSPVAEADRLLSKLKQAREWAQTAMAVAQERQEKAANKTRSQAPQYQVNDKVWLNLEKISTDRPSKKLDAKYAKYTVIEVIGSHAYRLDTPPGIHNVFHTRRLRPASSEPLPGQIIDDWLPAAFLVDGEDEYEVEEIQNEDGQKVLVKWKGYKRPTWEPRLAMENTLALDRWEAKVANGFNPPGKRRRSGRREVM
jgi:hypothetical protein